MRAFLACCSVLLFTLQHLLPTITRRGRSGCSFRSRRPASPICQGASVAEALRAKLGQPVVVENKPGANGVLGLRELLKADAGRLHADGRQSRLAGDQLRHRRPRRRSTR
jgi:hypothetical protein